MDESYNKPSHHYVCFDIENRPDLHITLCTLDKLSCLQLLPVIRGLINYFGVKTGSEPFDCINYPHESKGFVKEPATVLRVCFPPLVQNKCENFRNAFYVNRDGVHSGYTPHITFVNLEKLQKYINSVNFTRVKSISIVNAKTKKPVFTFDFLHQGSTWDSEFLTLLKAHNDFIY